MKRIRKDDDDDDDEDQIIMKIHKSVIYMQKGLIYSAEGIESK
jgi:hypothetical protein